MFVIYVDKSISPRGTWLISNSIVQSQVIHLEFSPGSYWLLVVEIAVCAAMKLLADWKYSLW